jgi:hypothetical protein
MPLLSERFLTVHTARTAGGTALPTSSVGNAVIVSGVMREPKATAAAEGPAAKCSTLDR